MFYRDINLPAVVEIRNSPKLDIDRILRDNHIYFENKVLFTQEELWNTYQNFFGVSTFSEIIFVKGGKWEETEEVYIKSDKQDLLLIAFGGGSVIDFVKMYAQKCNMCYVTIPSTLSNDAIYSPIARLSQNGIKKSFGVKSPIGIIVNTRIIKQSPSVLLLAGVGDLVSNLSAFQDCQLAIESGNESVDNLALLLSRMSVDGILKFTEIDLNKDVFLEQLALGLIISGLSMVLAHSSRPASGAEHLISHAIDQYYPGKSTLHGIQVAWAQLLLEKNVRNFANYDSIYCFYEKIGVLNIIKKHSAFTEEFFYELLPLAKNIRNRYTILNQVY